MSLFARLCRATATALLCLGLTATPGAARIEGNYYFAHQPQRQNVFKGSLGDVYIYVKAQAGSEWFWYCRTRLWGIKVYRTNTAYRGVCRGDWKNQIYRELPSGDVIFATTAGKSLIHLGPVGEEIIGFEGRSFEGFFGPNSRPENGIFRHVETGGPRNSRLVYRYYDKNKEKWSDPRTFFAIGDHKYIEWKSNQGFQLVDGKVLFYKNIVSGGVDAVFEHIPDT